ncbi:protein HIDE1 isoform X1 [Erinaceus europaeus]|uniref:Protein HIDE1 isoform X1 n=1 Tax=Erinaceus europaeus TaxID=9365 RepID=A0ABM3WMD2_ERIEU|nr:protein HIDE1 isoform X1 [Erinaceus europaeus]
MPLALLLLTAAGSSAFPPPSILLVPPHPSTHEDPIHIACVAPEGFPGANFTLYQGGQILQLVQAPADQLRVTFNLSGREAPGGPFQCQYGVLGEHQQPQLSDLSEQVHLSFPVPTWILALSLSLAGVFLLLVGLVAVAVVIKRVKVKHLQKKRERESCWTQMNFSNTAQGPASVSLPDLAFDNSLFTISMKMTSEAPLSDGTTASDLGPRKRPTSTSSSPEPPEFSTFRAC